MRRSPRVPNIWTDQGAMGGRCPSEQKIATVDGSDEDRQDHPLPERGIEEAPLVKHVRQRLTEHPVPVTRVQVWNRFYACCRELPDLDAVLPRGPLESEVDRHLRHYGFAFALPGGRARPTAPQQLILPSSSWPFGLHSPSDADGAYGLCRNVFSILPLSAGYISFGPSFTVSLLSLPAKRNGTW
jgi:hypothetical protein